MRTFTPDAAAALDGPTWLAHRRTAAAESFAATPLPTGAEELWRYSRIGQLDLDGFAPVSAAGPASGAARTLADGLGPRSALVVLADGRLDTFEIDPSLEGSVAVGGLHDGPAAEALLGTVAGTDDAFVQMNDAFVADGVLIDVRDGAVLPAPVVVVHWLEGASPAGISPAVFPRTLVRLETSAEATVVEVVAQRDGAGAVLVVPVTELLVGDDAKLSYVNVQVLGPQAWQVARQASRVGRDATFRSFAVGLGGSYARVRTDSELAGRGGHSELQAAYLGTGEQMHDFRTLQDHAAARTTSNLRFTGAVADHSRSAYSGLIRIRNGAAKADASQTNRNLVLSEGAHADSVPNLDIEENDVRCSHASTVGPVDEDQRFYLESRGVPPEEAESLIVLGFFHDTIDRSPLPGVQGWLRRSVAERLGRTGGRGGDRHG